VDLWRRDGWIDLALALVEADHGPEVAQRIARELLVFARRPGGQSQPRHPPGASGRAPGLAGRPAELRGVDLAVRRHNAGE
jgi:transcriptional regulator GlxA family with amidase domain